MESKLISATIANMSATSKAIDKLLDNPTHNNSYYGDFLERMSWELHRQAEDLKQIEGLYGVDL